ncbi:MAG: phosphoethanolamine transferase [Bacteroidaceae bacterium]|nr:phosphoethanolamine transferase [Bacteroidaceae bacterium]
MNSPKKYNRFGRYLRKALQYISKPIISNPSWFTFVYIWGCVCNTFVVWNGSRLVGYMQLFLELYLLTAIITIFPNKIRQVVKISLSILLCPISIIDLFCYCKLKMPITATLLNTFLQTDTSEATDALSSYTTIDETTYPVIILLLLTISATATALSKRARSFVGNIARKAETGIGVFATAALTIALYFAAGNEVYLFHKLILGKSEKEIYEVTQREPSVRLYTPAHRMASAIIEDRQERSTIVSLLSGIEKSTVEECAFTSPEIVLIIGESYSRLHSQLYGYDKPTTPYQAQLAKENNFVVYDNFIAQWNLTYDVFKNLLSTHCASDDGEWHQYPLFTTLFKNAGYNVTFLSNQFITSNDTYSDFQENILLNDSRMSKAQFDIRNEKRFEYDGELLDEYGKTGSSDKRGNLTIIHLMGQHIAFGERYPKEWEHFTASMYPHLPENEGNIVAQYDNATLYNDYILSRIIEGFEEKDAIIIHMPDHGERSGIKGNGYGRDFTLSRESIEEQYEVPFWIFMTQEYAKKHPAIAQKISDSRSKPLCTDNIAHLMLSLAGIKTQYYNARYNPLSADFDSTRHRLIWERFDYDKKNE